MARSPLDRLRKACLSFPQAHEVEAWGEPTFRVKNKIFAMYAAANNHHGDGRRGVWVKATPINQQLLLRADPHRYFSPPYVGPRGWIGIVLDDDPDWGAVIDLLRDAWRLTAPKRLAATLPDG